MIQCRLKEILEEKGMTAYALAKQAGVHQSVISKWKANKAKAYRSDILGKICEVLECEPGDILRIKMAKKAKPSHSSVK